MPALHGAAWRAAGAFMVLFLYALIADRAALRVPAREATQVRRGQKVVIDTRNALGRRGLTGDNVRLL